MTNLPSSLRRRLLQHISLFFLADAIPFTAYSTATSGNENQAQTFASFLDELLPRDSLSGSATDLGIHIALADIAKEDARFSKLIEQGCMWLNWASESRFASLSEEDRIKLISWMTESDWNQVPRRFYELVRQAAVEIYYSDPRALKGLPLNNAPQPLGYLPPWH